MLCNLTNSEAKMVKRLSWETDFQIVSQMEGNKEWVRKFARHAMQNYGKESLPLFKNALWLGFELGKTAGILWAINQIDNPSSGEEILSFENNIGDLPIDSEVL